MALQMDGLERVYVKAWIPESGNPSSVALSLTTHVALGELLNLCKLPPLQHEDNSTFLLELLGGLNEKTYTA